MQFLYILIVQKNKLSLSAVGPNCSLIQKKYIYHIYTGFKICE